jgi:hypothetical protein
MGKMKEQNQYLKDYPQLHKWINECIACHAKGYNPQIERKEEKIAVNNLKSILPPLEVNELGMCPICAKLLERN